MSKPWLTYVNLSDSYERKARFLPAVLSLLFLAPLLYAFKLPVTNWLSTILSGVGISAVLAVGLSHVSSAFGNRFQKHLWPRWPHDAPTNMCLNPNDTARSEQQKVLWYSMIKRITGLDIEAAVSTGEKTEFEAVINDAIAQLRNQLWSLETARRLRIHNEDYGFARNLTGMRPVWITLSVTSTVVCWLWYFFSSGEISWPIVSTVLSIVALVLGFSVLPGYVECKAHHYAETLFAAANDLDKLSAP